MPPIPPIPGCGWLCSCDIAVNVPAINTIPAVNPSVAAQTLNRMVNLSCHPSYTDLMSIVGNIAAIAKGMSITFGEIFQPTLVENYPDGKGPLRGAVLEARYRGAHVLQRDEDGLEKCVACFLCAAACPANCIYIEAAENTETVRISSSERYAKVYNIDYNRCIFCGYCVEACPTDAITHGHGFELATLNATNLVMRKEDMLVPVSALTAAK
jgi:NADH-quinone oxidoreductase subunit I